LAAWCTKIKTKIVHDSYAVTLSELSCAQAAELIRSLQKASWATFHMEKRHQTGTLLLHLICGDADNQRMSRGDA
jgi:hypothetical protein